eukprot:TRINITY_DN26814_c0_g4_i1.p1 TRINITY_DN26814_c0_g4~~TRINITY_DN26814_c0_g4_i1.p1  ORF type:complete len:129 (-),score=8.57 TRINITY_DN26814_c0_g4_i1:68-454(-)
MDEINDSLSRSCFRSLMLGLQRSRRWLFSSDLSFSSRQDVGACVLFDNTSEREVDTWPTVVFVFCLGASLITVADPVSQGAVASIANRRTSSDMPCNSGQTIGAISRHVASVERAARRRALGVRTVWR